MEGKSYSHLIKIAVFAIDFGFINLAFIIARKLGLANTLNNAEYTSFFLIFGLAWVISGFFNKVYRINLAGYFNIVKQNFYTLLTQLIIIGPIIVLFNIYNITAGLLLSLYALSYFFIVGSRLFYKVMLKYYQFTGFDQRKIVVVGATSSGWALYKYFINNEHAGYHFEGFFDDHSSESSEAKIVGPLNADVIEDFCTKKGIGEIYFALPVTRKELIREISKFADDHFIYFRLAPDFSEITHDRGDVFLLNSVPVLTIRKEPLHVTLNANLKRLFDIIFSTVVILTVFPFVLPLIALAIYIDSPGPIFFKQLRPGKNNKLFDCYKFRTMRVNQTTELQATKNDPRVTKVGAFLRKTSLDELPQFFNVLLGNMSVVGPRPNMVSQLHEYSKQIQNYSMRHFITPGITGYAQVNGLRGETKEVELMAKRVQYDVQYIENWSLWLDVKIIFLTVWNVVNGEKNAY